MPHFESRLRTRYCEPIIVAWLLAEPGTVYDWNGGDPVGTHCLMSFQVNAMRYHTLACVLPLAVVPDADRDAVQRALNRLQDRLGNELYDYEPPESGIGLHWDNMVVEDTVVNDGSQVSVAREGVVCIL